MKPIFTRYTIDNMLGETGDDYTHIHLFFKTENKPETIMPIIISYDELHYFIKNYDESAYNYLKKIRSDIHGYGPKHSKIFKVIEDENFDLEFHIKKYLETKDETYISNHYEWIDRIQKTENNEKIKDVA